MMKRNEQAVYDLRGLYENYGYTAYKMSRFEEYDLYVKNKDFLVSDQVITFSDRNGRLLALKPDVTLSIIKNATDQPGVVQKLYYNENVYRVEQGSFREIMQTGLECVGDLTAYDVAEVILLAVKSLCLLSTDSIMDVSHMGVIAAFLNESGLGAEARQKAMDCLRRKSDHELCALCEAEGVSAENTEKLCTLIRCSGPCKKAFAGFESLQLTPGQKEALDDLRCLCNLIAAQGYEEILRLDFSVASDMKYYSGIVFKGYVEGIPMSILSGGQYDKLLRKMGRNGQAVGFAVYVDLLERLGQNAGMEDLDTLILYGAKTDMQKLLTAVQTYAQEGSVLAVTQIPEYRSWRRLVKIQ